MPLMPIVHLPNREERLKLVSDLWALGWRRSYCNTLSDVIIEMPDTSPYVFIDPGDRTICRVSYRVLPGLTGGSNPRVTMTNSATHFLAYLRRHRITPTET